MAISEERLSSIIRLRRRLPEAVTLGGCGNEAQAATQIEGSRFQR
jgi:hypothetical protein